MQMMKAIRVSAFGGPEVMELIEMADPVAGENEELITVSSIGVNYADTHQIEDTYRIPQSLPLYPGLEVVGRTSSGKRVLAATSGAYAQKAVAHRSSMVEIPAEVSDEQALAMWVQGVTAWHILKTMGRLQSGETVLIHAAAGGVGSLALQLAKNWGAKVIAVTSGGAKQELAKSLGADLTIDAQVEDLEGAILAANGGNKVDLILEMVDGRTFDASFATLAPFGRLVTFGSASRTLATPIPPRSLVFGTRTVAGFWLGNCGNEKALVHDVIVQLFEMIKAGELKPVIGPIFPLSQAPAAHRAILGRETTGKVTLNPAL